MAEIKSYISGFMVRWLLKIGGGFFLSIGIDDNSLTLIVSSIVSIILGLIISLVQHTKALNAEVEP
jgi:hypothetical protein